jgi:hypothetical protein
MRASRFALSRATLVVVLCACGSDVFGQSEHLYGLHPGKADATAQESTITLKNAAFEATWYTADGKLRGGSFAWSPAGSISLPADVFLLIFADGRKLTSTSMRIVEAPRIEHLTPNPQAARLEERFPGKRVSVRFEDPATKFAVTWSAILRDGDNYIRQEVSLSAASDAPVLQVRLLDLPLPDAKVLGVVRGSPAASRNVLFFGFEHPLSSCGVFGDQLRCSIERDLPVKAGQTVTYSCVIGVAPFGQMRRAFLNYLERQRAHPYRAFLHYNSWYDIGYTNRYNQDEALDAINAFGKELYEKRHVKLDSFLFDDGWDNTHSLWTFNSGFPDGFTPLKNAAAKYGAAPGIWFSPWGGYGNEKEERLKYAKQQGYETNEGGFALSGPKYFARFQEVTTDFIRKYNINQFKIDGTGNVNRVFPGSQFDSDFHAAISLIDQWRSIKPDIFVNLTTGTFPSPFWLRYADSIWRSGEDHDFTGVGPWREKWITYRDSHTYAGIVQQGPLFPLNSLMLHGIIYAQHAEHLGDDPEHVFVHEVHSYFGEGTQLQEMYITHALLSDADWDTLAEAANWSRRNSAALSDTHWIGGDPEKLQVYGWAAWSPEKGILTLRNPSDHPQTISLDVAQAFELPPGAAQNYTAHSPWKSDRNSKPLALAAGESHTFELKPFEVLTLEAIPIH